MALAPCTVRMAANHAWRVKAGRMLIWSIHCYIPVRVISSGAGYGAERKPQAALQGGAHEGRVNKAKQPAKGTWQWPEPAWPANAHGARPWQGNPADRHRGGHNPIVAQKPMRVVSEHRGARRESMRRGCLRGGQSTHARQHHGPL
eukprot:6212591-Pleurochrysis_carterae.AAC.1